MPHGAYPSRDKTVTGRGTSPAFLLMAVLAVGNVALWGVAAAVFWRFPILWGTSALAYALGLRHALDADHIAAIDNVTRRLVNADRRPVATGLFFSLGHSSIVLLLAVLVALGASQIHHHFPLLQQSVDMVGSLVSALFLLAMGFVNVLVLRESLAALRAARRQPDGPAIAAPPPQGLFNRLLTPLLRSTDRSWKMYPIGVLFGLGFDTATEVAVLGISAATAIQHIPLWTILLFPTLFCAGMILLDTADGLLMARAYSWALIRASRKLYYNAIMTAVTVVVAVVIGSLEIVGLARHDVGPWWAGVAASVNHHFALIGAVMVAAFLILWLSLRLLQNWRFSEVAKVRR